MIFHVILFLVTFNDMFVLYLEMFCPGKFNDGIQTRKTGVVFSYSQEKKSEKLTSTGIL